LLRDKAVGILAKPF